MEHVVEGLVLDRLVCFIDFIHQCPLAETDLLPSFAVNSWGLKLFREPEPVRLRKSIPADKVA